MSDKTVSITPIGDRELQTTRAFDAPRTLVFDAWTKPELLKRWYGPRGWTLVVCEIDLRVGGAWRYVTRKPNGREVGQRGVYREIVHGERIVHTESWEDWNPGEVLVTTVFEEHDGKTTLTSTTTFPSRDVRDELLRSGLADGVSDSYDKLEELLSRFDLVVSRTFDLVVSRTFEVDAATLFRAWSESEAVMKWWGPTGFTCPLARMDFREGGTSLVCMRMPQELGGHDMFNTWTYERIVPDARIEFSLRFADAEGRALDPASLGIPGVPAVVPHVITFTGKGDRATEMTVVEQGYATREALELSKQGLLQCLDKLAAMLR